jgi:hypothetical protein
MSIALLGLIILGTGAIGGLINAYFADGGFVRPKKEELNGTIIWRPGWIGNFGIGGFAALVSWGLYGPMASASITSNEPGTLTISALAGAILLGIGGARVLTNEVDKRLLKATASAAAQADGSSTFSRKIASAPTAIQALNFAKEEMKKSGKKQNV